MTNESGLLHKAVCDHAETSDDPVASMLRDVDERLRRTPPDVHGAQVGVHAARLAVSVRLISPAGEVEQAILRKLANVPQPKGLPGALVDALADVNAFVAGLNAKAAAPRGMEG